MHAKPVVAMAAKIKVAKRIHYAADDARDWPEAHRTGVVLTNLELAERDIAPASKECAAQKLENSIADVESDPGVDAERFVRSARPLVRKIKRGAVTSRDLRTLRSLMPIALQHSRDISNDSAARALTHVIDWCARPKLV